MNDCIICEKLKAEIEQLRAKLKIYEDNLSGVSDRTGLLAVLKIGVEERMKLKAEIEAAKKQGER